MVYGFMTMRHFLVSDSEIHFLHILKQLLVFDIFSFFFFFWLVIYFKMLLEVNLRERRILEIFITKLRCRVVTFSHL